MRVPTLIVHIGTAKTGSTAIQTALHRHRDDLRRVGIGYVHGAGFVNARDLAAACTDGDDDLLDELGLIEADRIAAFRRQVVDRLRDDVRALHVAPDPVGEHDEHVGDHAVPLHTIVISSEHFHSRLVAPAMVQRLADVLVPLADRVRVVCYLRRQVDLVASFWSTYLRNGGTDGLDAVGDRLLRIGNPYADYDALLSMWAAAFGADAVEPRIFGEFDGGTVLTDLAAVIGAPPGLLSERAPENESVNRVGQLLLLATNRAVERGGDADLLREARAVLASRFAGPGARWPPDEAARRQAQFDDGNEVVRRRWFPDRDVLFPAEFAEPPAIEITDDQVEAMADVLARVAAPVPSAAPAEPVRRRFRRR